ncbi:hypothetical protein DYB37_004979 [Aphanomyces astaci]|uniref:Uncharacterized protein n=1 Tax=Aphanomyces astaci TaxID=112090 RepID=A0A3R6Y532_APHAT|nr:hypothetical protein DYB35_004262 [Aphanomyces astaci]RHZ17191.1 hypothetical protein DYB37_004979 [Aphanomyces astaci]
MHQKSTHMRELHDSVDQDAKRLTNDKHVVSKRLRIRTFIVRTAAAIADQKHLVRPCLGSKRQASFTLAKAILFDGEPSTSMKSQWKGGNEAAINPTKYPPTHPFRASKARLSIELRMGDYRSYATMAFIFFSSLL